MDRPADCGVVLVCSWAVGNFVKERAGPAKTIVPGAMLEAGDATVQGRWFKKDMA